MKRIAVAALCLCPLLSNVAAHATTYKMMSDDHLADAASAIAQVRVTAVEPSPVAGMPSTDYLVQIERLVKGFVPGSTLVVRVPGGIGADGLGLKIWGAPAFRRGERALLFLAPHAEFFSMKEKMKRQAEGAQPNPFIDPQGYHAYLAEGEKNFQDLLTKQKQEQKKVTR